MGQPAEIGLIGLGVMGRNLALNIAERGFPVAVYNRSFEATRDLVASEGAAGRPIVACETLEDVAGSLRRPRAVLLMVKAGEPTDEQIERLAPLLEPGDVIVDGGNAHFQDSIRRSRALEARGLRFLGCGISGGEEGARHGPSIMAGGAKEAYERVQPVLEAVAAKVDGEPCCAHLGPDGAGHFVKMLHNGIEYADMQMIAEAYGLMRELLQLEPAEMAPVFAEWNQGELESYLIEITAEILARRDAETGRPLVDVILDSAGQKGTGAWTVAACLELGVPVPTIAEAVFARGLSARKAERTEAEAVLGRSEPAFAGSTRAFLAELHDALLVGRIVAYAQGFAALATAGPAHGWRLDPATVARIWRGGCILRAALLEHIKEAHADAFLANLLLDPAIAERVRAREGGLRTIVAQAADAGLPVPALASALAYLDGYRRGRGFAGLIQAQRDRFGAHGYERIDRPGRFHGGWHR